MAAVRAGAPFVGRTEELGRLTELMAAARDGQAAGVLLAGDAGVGKTSLVAELARRVSADGVLVLVGRCVDLGTGGLPYLPFAEILTHLVRAGDTASGPETAAAAVVREAAAHGTGLGRLAGDVPATTADRVPGEAGLDRLALFDAVAAVLTRIAREVAPVLLVVEDLHWADASTRDLMRFLLARLDRDRVLVVATYRSDDLHRRHPVRPLLAELVRLPAVERITLPPFGPEELAEFLTAVHGAELPADLVQDIAARSAGNAYLAEELLAAGQAEDRLPAALADVLLDRLERLADPARQVVRVASVIGNCRIEDAMVRAAARGAAGLDGDDVEAALREAVAHHVLVPENGDRYAFRHALLQEAVYADLLPGERVRLHAAVARELAGTGGPAAERARHSLAAHDLPQALRASLEAAAEAAARLSPAEALSHYEQALQLWDVVPAAERPDEDLVDVGLRAAAAAADAGLHERAVALTRSALAEAERRGTGVAEARSRLALHLYATERLDDARAEARRSAAGLPPGPPSAARVWARAIEARVDQTRGEAEAALAVVEPALAEARDLSLLTAEADLLVTRSLARSLLGTPDAEADLDAARAVAERAGDAATMLRASFNLAVDRYEEAEHEAALEVIEAALAEGERAGLGSSLYAVNLRSLLVTVRWTRADPDGALLAVEAARRQVPVQQARHIAHAALPVHVARHPEAALDAIETLRSDDMPWDGVPRLFARADALGWLGRPLEGVQAAGSALDLLDAAGEPYHLGGISIATTAVSLLADEAERARRRNDTQAERAAIGQAGRFLADGRERGRKGRPRHGAMGPEGRAWLARLEAEAARLKGKDDVGLWRRAVDGFAEFGAVFEEARCRRRLAERLLVAGDRAGARNEAAAVLTTARALRARPLHDAAEDFARRARLDPAAASSTSSGDRLTPRERDVMRLVAEGLTNRAIGERLFISEKTASVHVSNVLAKLGASGRAEAVAIAARRGLLPSDAAPGRPADGG